MRFSHTMRPMASDAAIPTLLDTLVPTWTDRTVQGLDVAASPERVAASIRATSLDDAQVARAQRPSCAELEHS